MKDIKMVDLQRQYLRMQDEINQGIQEVIDTTTFINGPAVQKFQKNLENYLDVKHVIPCANGTDALQVALMALNLQQGDEIITPSFTFVATVEVIELLKLKPVFIDVDPDTFIIKAEDIEKAITPKTKVILPVHLFGQSANMENIMKLAKKHNIFVLEDNCQAIGSDVHFSDGTSKKSGTIGHIGCTSFFPSKNLGCYGDGGAIFTNDDALAKDMKSIVNHGMVVKYYHDKIGVNSRLDTIQAAILDVKLRHLDEFSKSRRKAAEFYNAKLGSHLKLKIPYQNSHSTHVFHQYTLIAVGFNRDELISYLQTKDIPAMIYYPVPLHLQVAYEHLGYKKGDLPITEELSKNVFSLPMHTELTENELTYICNSVLEFLNK